MNNNINMILCEARHNVPSTLCKDGFIFPKTVNKDMLVNTQAMYDYAYCRLKQYANTTDIVKVVVTGLTIACTTVIKVCKDLNINLILLHYDRENDSYFAQCMV